MAIHAIHSRAVPLVRAGANRQGVTLVELLLALCITSLVATAVTAMLYSMSRGIQSGRDLRRQDVQALVVGHRIDSAIRSSNAILASGERFVVLWIADSRADEKPNLSELCRIEWDEHGKQILAYAAPGDLPEADDIAYDLTFDFAGITSALKGSSHFVAQTWGTDVLQAQFRPSGATMANRLLGYSISFQGQEQVYSIDSTVALRGQTQP